MQRGRCSLGSRVVRTGGDLTPGLPQNGAVAVGTVDNLRGRGEALTGARAGRAIELRNQSSGVPTLSGRWKATLLAALSRAALQKVQQ